MLFVKCWPFVHAIQYVKNYLLHCHVIIKLWLLNMHFLLKSECKSDATQLLFNFNNISSPLIDVSMMKNMEFFPDGNVYVLHHQYI